MLLNLIDASHVHCSRFIVRDDAGYWIMLLLRKRVFKGLILIMKDMRKIRLYFVRHIDLRNPLYLCSVWFLFLSSYKFFEIGSNF